LTYRNAPYGRAAQCEIQDQAYPSNAAQSILLRSEAGFSDVLAQAISPGSRTDSGCCRD
jgi:hypothetical protein